MEGRALEEAIARWTGFRPAGPGRPFDLSDPAGRTLLEVKARLRGIRDLAADVLQLASRIADRPAERACLLVVASDVSADRLRLEWDRARAALRPGIARRIRLVVLDPRIAGFESDEPWVRRIREGLGKSGPAPALPPRPSPLSAKVFEIEKVLVQRWLLGHRPTPIHRLIRDSGSSYPMVARTLARLEEKGVLRRATDRSVSLSGFPPELWSELAAVSETFRRPLRFVDVTGRSGPRDLLRRLEKAKPPGLALGGVHAARHWDPRLDLRGIPRLDVSLHLSPGPGSLDFLKALDPALKPARDAGGEPLLVVHPLARGASLFRERPGALPVADPVEAVLDLLEMRLGEQADALVARLTDGRTG